MIADEHKDIQKPEINIPKGQSINYILGILKSAPPHFKKALVNKKLSKPLNENKLTQILVEQINALLKEKNSPINAQTQYIDVFFGARGITDFYFYPLELGKTQIPLFVVESKRLPNPNGQANEREYVIGQKQNGGIERFKLEKHGKGMTQAGMIGFLEEGNPNHWKNKINEWIHSLSQENDTIWNDDEQLISEEENKDYSYLTSIARKISNEVMELNHIWIEIKNAR